jgi:F-type H+-transporting ATPase subunit delta
VRDVAVAGRYARALFIVTEKRTETARALEDLKNLVRVLEPGSRVSGFLASPEARLAEKRQVLKKALDGRALPVVVLFLDLLLRKHRLAGFPTIVEEFESLVEKALGVQRAQVVSAVPLHPDEVSRLHQSLEQHTRAHIRLTTAVDPSILGGALVRIGDTVIDRSVRTLLESIEKQLNEVSV